MGREKSPNQQLEQYSRGRLRTKFSNWILNSHDEEDFGFDYDVRLTEPEERHVELSATQFYLQLKASESFDNEETVFWDLDVEYLVDDCLNARVPVVLLIYEKKADEFYWCVLQPYCWDNLNEQRDAWQDQETVRIRIDRDSVIKNNSKETFPDRYPQRGFHQAIEDAQERITFRLHANIVRPDSDKAISPVARKLADTDEIIQYKKRRVERGRKLLDAGNKSQALSILLEVYNLPEWDEPSIEAIIELLQTREITHPMIAFAQNEFSETGLEVADELNDSEAREFLLSQRENARHAIDELMVGARFFHKDPQEEMLVLAVNDWAHTASDKSYLVALLQYADGTFYDENAAAVAGNDEYKLLETGIGSNPLQEACDQRHHDFDENMIRANYKEGKSVPLICETCGLSVRTLMETLGHDTPIACAECGDIVYDFEEGMICERCTKL